MKAKNHLYLSGAIFSFVLGVYAPALFNWKKREIDGKEIPKERDRVLLYIRKIKNNDNFLAYQEYLNGALFFRKIIGDLSKGDVLEVAAGSCRNLHFFKPLQVTSLTFTDIFSDLLLWANEKHIGNQESNKNKEKYDRKSDRNMVNTIKYREKISFEYKPPGSKPILVKLAESDTSDLKGFESDSYDTVIDSFGLCSYESPLKAVDEMIRVCKPGGRILFLEHGKGSNRLVNLILEKKRLKHLQSWGCFWDRNILEFISNNDKIEVAHIERRTMGTVYFVVAIKK